MIVDIIALIAAFAAGMYVGTNYKDLAEFTKAIKAKLKG